MPTNAKKEAPRTDKQNVAEEITKKLEVALESFREVWGEKKFNNRIKKAAKLFLKGKPKQGVAKKKATPAKKKVVNRSAKKAAPAKKKAASAIKKAAPAKK